MAKEKPTTKVCKHCKTEIAYDAKVCPQCRKKQGGGIVKKILIAFGVILVISFLFGGEDEEVKTGNADTSENVNDEQSTNESETSSDSTEESNVSDNSVVNVGGYFEIDGLKVTINESDLEYTEYEDEYDWYALEDGLKYIRVAFTYENSSDSDKYVSIYDYDCYADGTLCEQSYNFGDDFMNANLSTGRNVSFETFYVVPSDAQEIELEYTENMWTSEKIIIKLQ